MSPELEESSPHPTPGPWHSLPEPEPAGRPRKAHAALHLPEQAVPLPAEDFQPGPAWALPETEFPPSGEGGFPARATGKHSRYVQLMSGKARVRESLTDRNNRAEESPWQPGRAVETMKRTVPKSQDRTGAERERAPWGPSFHPPSIQPPHLSDPGPCLAPGSLRSPRSLTFPTLEVGGHPAPSDPSGKRRTDKTLLMQDGCVQCSGLIPSTAHFLYHPAARPWSQATS